MKRKNKLVAMVVFAAALIILVAAGITYALADNEPPYKLAGITYALADNEPPYKLQESVRAAFRPDWTWDDSKKDYNDLGDLKRDPDTGLFPEPSPIPKELEGYSHWDAYLGLYIIDTIQIDHKTGEITEVPPKQTTEPVQVVEWPEYKWNAEDPFDQTYKKYCELELEKYPERIHQSAPAPEIEIFKKEGLTPEWFGISVNDLPLVISKLELGAPPSYTMSLFELLTNADVGVEPTKDSTHKQDWYKATKKMLSEASERVKQGDVKGLGYLALPYIYDEMKAGTRDALLPLLPELADKLNGCDKAAASLWSEEEWLKWFEENSKTMDILKQVAQKGLNMPWLE